MSTTGNINTGLTDVFGSLILQVGGEPFGKESLYNPTEVTLALVFMVLGISFILLFAGVYMKSFISILMWVFVIMSFVFWLVLDITLAFFWIAVVANAIMIGFSMAAYALNGVKV